MSSESDCLTADEDWVHSEFKALAAAVDSDPPTLYHYTSQVGFLGIVESKTLWATQIQYLNDSRELALAVGLVRSHLETRRGASTDEVLDLLLKYVESAADKGLTHRRCVVSFTEVGDQLSQWRGYCPQGTGFALGFQDLRPGEISARTAAAGRSVEPRPCAV